MRQITPRSVFALALVGIFLTLVVWVTRQDTGYSSRISTETSVGDYVKQRYR